VIKIKEWLLNNIGLISIYLIITSVGNSILFHFFKNTNILKFTDPIFGFDYINLNFFNLDIFDMRIAIDESSYFSFTYLNYIFYLFFLVGVILYWHSKQKEKRILKFSYSIIFIFSFLSLFNRIKYLFKAEEFKPLYIVFFMKIILIIYLCYIILKYWKKKEKYIKIEKLQLIDYRKFKYKRTITFNRFVHFSIDTFLIFSIFSNYVRRLPKEWIRFLENEFGNDISRFLLFTIFSTIYYVFFEAIFKTTPAKYLTNSSIVSLKNSPLKFENILGRTLARRIPFNSFSFFGKLGWHDMASNTTVVQLEKDTDAKKYDIIISIIVITIIVLFTYLIVREDYFNFF